MKYTAKITQDQYVGNVLIEPKGGDLTANQVIEIKKDPWGKELIRKELLVIDGVKPADIEDEPKKGASKKKNQKADTVAAPGVTVNVNQEGGKN
jgi:hypothetical protein